MQNALPFCLPLPLTPLYTLPSPQSLQPPATAVAAGSPKLQALKKAVLMMIYYSRRALRRPTAIERQGDRQMDRWGWMGLYYAVFILL